VVLEVGVILEPDGVVLLAVGAVRFDQKPHVETLVVVKVLAIGELFQSLPH